MKEHRQDIYSEILSEVEKVSQSDHLQIEKFQLGLTWSSCRVKIDRRDSIGFAMSPIEKTRMLNWPGTIVGQKLANITSLLKSWDNFNNTLALASCNAVLNSHRNELMQNAEIIDACEYANLAVFYYFKSKLADRKVVVIGRYPNLDKILHGINYTILERWPEGNDVSDTYAEHVLPEADWVFITASTLINKSFDRLSLLASSAVTVLMGPSTPWLWNFSHWDIDFIAGVIPKDIHKAEQIVVEGGGVRLFDCLHYAVVNISHNRLAQLKSDIKATFERREKLKLKMEAWYAQGNTSRFPKRDKLAQTDAQLSQLDTAYKRLWDANQ